MNVHKWFSRPVSLSTLRVWPKLYIKSNKYHWVRDGRKITPTTCTEDDSCLLCKEQIAAKQYYICPTYVYESTQDMNFHGVAAWELDKGTLNSLNEFRVDKNQIIQIKHNRIEMRSSKPPTRREVQQKRYYIQIIRDCDPDKDLNNKINDLIKQNAFKVAQILKQS